ncbi:hypothetical protein ACOKGD_14605 [Microbacterium phosphatis]|uniref:hypothetical protein n=1 Tax=Microbacterium phosphatis TaxID=3140248 RepID=UPI0031400249
MNALDPYTLSLATTLVVLTSGVVFLLETVVRRGSAPGRFWAASFLAGILTALCYTAWTLRPEVWLAVAVGNAAFVAQMGLMWLGCRICSRPLSRGARFAVVAGALAAFGAAALEHEVGTWAGAGMMLAGIGVFAALGAVETRRGLLRDEFAAWGLTFVLGAAALYYAARTVAFLVAGPGSAPFADWFGTAMTSLVTIALTIVGAVTTSVLRASFDDRSSRRSGLAAAEDAVLLPAETLLAALDDVTTRAERTQEPIALIALRVAGVDELGAAFGQAAAERIDETWRAAVHRNAPPTTLVGELDGSTAGVLMRAASRSDAARPAEALRQCLLDDLVALPDGVLPDIGVGIALSRDVGYDARALRDAACDAAAADPRVMQG